MVDYRDTLKHGARLLLEGNVDLEEQDVLAAQAIVDDRARKDDWFRMARLQHGDIEDAKAAIVLIAEEEGFDLEPEDVEFVTDEPPTATFL